MEDTELANWPSAPSAQCPVPSASSPQPSASFHCQPGAARSGRWPAGHLDSMDSLARIGLGERVVDYEQSQDCRAGRFRAREAKSKT